MEMSLARVLDLLLQLAHVVGCIIETINDVSLLLAHDGASGTASGLQMGKGERKEKKKKKKPKRTRHRSKNS